METATTLPGPLTAFDPPASCFNQIWYNFIGTHTDIVLGNPYDTGCKPSGWNTAVQYSPALCPSSYYNAQQQVVTTNSKTETVIDCCPSSFAHDGGTYSCVSEINTLKTAVAYTYSSNGATFTTVAHVSGQGVNAHSIQVRYRSRDLTLLSSATTDTPSTTTATSLSSSNAAPTTTSTPTTPSTGGLSTGAKAGIGVGVALGVILALIVGWLSYRARKRKRPSTQLSSQYQSNDGSYADHTVELEHPVQSKQTYPMPVELAAPVGGLSGSDTRSRHELPGS